MFLSTHVPIRMSSVSVGAVKGCPLGHDTALGGKSQHDQGPRETPTLRPPEYSGAGED